VRRSRTLSKTEEGRPDIDIISSDPQKAAPCVTPGKVSSSDRVSPPVEIVAVHRFASPQRSSRVVLYDGLLLQLSKQIGQTAMRPAL
jgi:hypothetical protein